MEKKNTGLIVLVVILCLLVGGLGGYIICDKVINKDNDIDNNVVKDIRINTEKDYVYDADYSYDNKYTEFVRKNGNDKVINIDRYGLSVSGRIGKQYLSDLKVPYLNINSDYAKASNEEIKKKYIEYAKRFDACAEIDQDKAVSCSQILTYKTFKYNNILSVVIISSIQATSKWVLDYNIYNIDLTSSKEIKYSDMVSTLGYDNDTLLDKEKELLKNKMNELWGTDFDLNTLCFAEDKNCYNIANKMLETSINDGSVLYFVNDNGNLNILVVPYADFVQDGNINKYLIEVTK